MSTREGFYRWWATLSNDERRDCWYDLDAMAHPEVVSSLKTKLAAATVLVAQRDAELAAVTREVEAWRALVWWTHRGIDRGLDAYDGDVLIVAANKVVFIGKTALECVESIPGAKKQLQFVAPDGEEGDEWP